MRTRVRNRPAHRQTRELPPRNEAAAEPPPSCPPPFPRAALAAMAAAFAVCAYLSLVNLDWAPVWIDEGISVYLARNWMEFGAPLADDGRNLYTAFEGRDIKPDGSVRYPPLMPALTALSFAAFGAGEIQARLVSALSTLAAMALFALILRREFPRAPWLAAVAFALVCLSPFTLGYARSATYNALLLLLHMTVFLSYLEFCARPRLARQIGWAALMTAAAIAAYHAHYLSNMIFMASLGAMHLLFRRREFDLRMWLIAAVAGGVYAAQAAWHALKFAAETGYLEDPVRSGLFAAIGWAFFFLNSHNFLAWSVMLWGAWWWWQQARARKLAHAHEEEGGAHEDGVAHEEGVSHEESVAHEEDVAHDARVAHFFALALFAVALLILWKMRSQHTAIRYISTLAPFAAVVGAAAVCWLWRRTRIGGGALLAVLLFTNVAAWPVAWRVESGKTPMLTLPKLALEYHRDYPDGQREALAYLRARLPKDTLVYTNDDRGAWLWNLSDHLLFCCAMYRGSGAGEIRARAFAQNMMRGDFTPDYLLLWGPPSAHNAFRMRAAWGPHPQGEFMALPGERVYRRAADFPEVPYGPWSSYRMNRPEPVWHVSRPDLARTHSEAPWPNNEIQLLRLYQRVRP